MASSQLFALPSLEECLIICCGQRFHSSFSSSGELKVQGFCSMMVKHLQECSNYYPTNLPKIRHSTGYGVYYSKILGASHLLLHLLIFAVFMQFSYSSCLICYCFHYSQLEIRTLLLVLEDYLILSL